MDDDAEEVEMEEEPAGGCFPWILALSGGGGAVSVEAPEVGAAAPRVSPSRPLTGGGSGGEGCRQVERGRENEAHREEERETPRHRNPQVLVGVLGSSWILGYYLSSGNSKS